MNYTNHINLPAVVVVFILDLAGLSRLQRIVEREYETPERITNSCNYLYIQRLSVFRVKHEVIAIDYGRLLGQFYFIKFSTGKKLHKAYVTVQFNCYI